MKKQKVQSGVEQTGQAEPHTNKSSYQRSQESGHMLLLPRKSAGKEELEKHCFIADSFEESKIESSMNTRKETRN